MHYEVYFLHCVISSPSEIWVNSESHLLAQGSHAALKKSLNLYVDKCEILQSGKRTEKAEHNMKIQCQNNKVTAALICFPFIFYTKRVFFLLSTSVYLQPYTQAVATSHKLSLPLESVHGMLHTLMDNIQ